MERAERTKTKISLEIRRCERSLWELFKRHHYLSGNLHRSATCFVGLIENRPAVFVAALQFPHPHAPGWREHRCVCLPDFQGAGLGSAVSEFVASLFAATGKPYLSVTSHPAMIRHRTRSDLWTMLRSPSRVMPKIKTQSATGKSMPTQLDRTLSWRRRTATFRYQGRPAAAETARQFQVLK